MCLSNTGLGAAYSACRDRLIDAKLLVPSGVRGLYGLSGRFEAVIEGFERLVTLRGRTADDEIVHFPAIMNRADYLKTSHLDSFPDLLGSVHGFHGKERDHLRLLEKRDAGADWTEELSPTDIVLTPAACYPLYPTSTGRLSPEGRTVDLRSFVFRHEPSDDPARMQIFRQREFVRMGDANQALAHRNSWIERGEAILNEVGLNVVREVANDPFFGRGGKLMAASQKEQDLKYELLYPIATTEKPTAIASCNYHLDSFGRTFGIESADGLPAHTACIGFGLERIALALFQRHGFNESHWPASVKTAISL